MKPRGKRTSPWEGSGTSKEVRVSTGRQGSLTMPLSVASVPSEGYLGSTSTITASAIVALGVRATLEGRIPGTKYSVPSPSVP